MSRNEPFAFNPANPVNPVYKCIFFDLDHTLWDYDTNSHETLQELYARYELKGCGVGDCADFQQQFKQVTFNLWELYDRGLIDSQTVRRERFKQVLEHFDVYNEPLCEQLSDIYLQECPNKATLIPHALETLTYLAEKYPMTIVTNGIEKIQHMKLAAGDLHRFFQHIVTAEKAGHKKPSRGIFDYAMNASGVAPHEVIMIGDNLLTDIGGAINASIDTVFYNPEKVQHTVSVKHEIASLAELRNIL